MCGNLLDKSFDFDARPVPHHLREVDDGAAVVGELRSACTPGTAVRMGLVLWAQEWFSDLDLCVAVHGHPTIHRTTVEHGIAGFDFAQTKQTDATSLKNFGFTIPC